METIVHVSNLAIENETINTQKASHSLFGEKLYQPTSFKLPKRKFGKKTIVKQLFLSQWPSSWPWLNYEEQRDLVFCYTCEGVGRKTLHSITHLEGANISTGL